MPPSLSQGRSWWRVRRFRSVFASGFLFILSACAVGPDFKKPDPPVPAAWVGQGDSTTTRESVTGPSPVELVEWWKSFKDPVLTSLVERAIESNLDLRQAEARIRQARATRGVAASALWPEIDAAGSYRRTGNGGGSTAGSGGQTASQGGTAPSGNGFRGTVTNLFQVGLDAAWELDIFGGTRRNVEATNADLQAALEDRRDVLVSLVSEVGDNYLNLRGLQQQIVIARKNLEAQKHTAEITRRRFEAGFVGKLDVANAQAQVATTESQIPVFESAAQGTIYNLSVLLGREPAALAEELASDAPIPSTPPEIPVGLPSDLLRRRPDIRRAEAQLHAATARIGVATADLFPKFSLTGSAGFASTDINTLLNWTSRAWAYGPSVTWPIFSAGRIRWNIEVQKAVKEQTLAAYEKSVLTALKDVETALVAYA
ncbi:MAG: efflux transporter outer membrane subunit, partial [Syntrophobacteraceae bacterium]|nr:efflux transporter outer membrane subunit [Syntrophobacteraceae bacterium]